jgi:hypothetical protein
LIETGKEKNEWENDLLKSGDHLAFFASSLPPSLPSLAFDRPPRKKNEWKKNDL